MPTGQTQNGLWLKLLNMLKKQNSKSTHSLLHIFDLWGSVKRWTGMPLWPPKTMKNGMFKKHVRVLCHQLHYCIFVASLNVFVQRWVSIFLSLFLCVKLHKAGLID